MESKESALAQRSQRKLFFDHKDMDYYFSWIVGRELYEGSDREECFAVAARIPSGDIASWQREWAELAGRVAEQARVALAVGDSERARQAYLRACTYYRAPLFIMRPKEPAFRHNWLRMHDCFRQAARLFDPPIEAVAVPYQGKQLSGYFWKADDSAQQRPTLLLVGGMETFAEDCYFVVGSEGPRRGYNVLTVDLPGQGMNPDQGLFLEARMGIPMQAAIDYALTRPEVNPDRLVTYGFSWGGHIVFKGAAHDRRLKAMIANPPMPDVFRAAWAQQQGHDKSDPVARVAFDQIAWRFGLKVSLRPSDLWKRLVKAYQYLFYGKTNLGDIRCPVLCLAGEGEARITLDIARETIARLPHPRSKLRIFTREEGGEAHCQIDNLALPNRTMFDWLEEVVEPRATRLPS
ncbi:MAG: alpha/beta hydrolase family protein [Chloroflexota bacterium]